MKDEKSISFLTKFCIVIAFGGFIIAFLSLGHLTKLLHQEKSINVLVWGQVLDKEFLSDFEQETGIRVNMSYIENNEELFAKLHSTESHDYDLVMPSDWAVELLIKDGLIKKLDRSKISAWDNVYPTLCHHYFDPGNEYTIPFFWSLMGLGVNKFCWNKESIPQTWGLIFDQQIMPKRIGMIENPRAFILLAAFYLFGEVRSFNNNEIDAVKKLLITQKSHVEIYTDSRSEYVLAAGDVSVGVVLSSDLLKIMKRFENIDFIIPHEGAFAIIDSFAITTISEKDDFVYAFLNYLFRPDIVEKYVNKFDFFPAVQLDIVYDDRFAQLTEPTDTLFNKIYFFKDVIPKEVVNDILITLKT
ncbi:MAG TPA: spermidine/putrescine ABC transporter substrate-binding protein [Candidatus Babeliales bacterium]|jgi:spermidine/putrescine transport system substrate-binding protein|nr:spermidine/putrescine ABC transporter substrate-binding protein [Candidatus Babeliales bacterium]